MMVRLRRYSGIIKGKRQTRVYLELPLGTLRIRVPSWLLGRKK